ncbi:MAG: ATP-binding protein [Alphaproteobacteria bacterium]
MSKIGPLRIVARVLQRRGSGQGLRAADEAEGRPSGPQRRGRHRLGHDRHGRQARSEADPAEPAVERHQIHAARRASPWRRRVQGDKVLLSVADTGIGIPAADLPRLGKPFEQATQDSNLAKAGTGLGLALVRSLASSMAAI